MSQFLRFLSLIASGHWHVMREFYTQLAFSLTVKLSLCSTRRHTEGAKVWLHSFLTLAIDGSEWSRHVPQYRPSRYPLNRRLDTPPPPEHFRCFGEGTEMSCAYRDSNTGPTCPSPNRYTNWAMPALNLRNTTTNTNFCQNQPSDSPVTKLHGIVHKSPWFNFKESGLLGRDAASFGERHAPKTGILNCIAVKTLKTQPSFQKCTIRFVLLYNFCKGKDHPVTGHEGPEGK